MVLNDLPQKRTEIILVSEIVPKCCILDSFVYYEGCSVSSKKFLPTVVDIMVI